MKVIIAISLVLFVGCGGPSQSQLAEDYDQMVTESGYDVKSAREVVDVVSKAIHKLPEFDNPQTIVLPDDPVARPNSSLWDLTGTVNGRPMRAVTTVHSLGTVTIDSIKIDGMEVYNVE